MAHTDKDTPLAVQLGLDEDGWTNWGARPRRKKHARLLQSSHARCNGGIRCCGVQKNARAFEKRVWRKEVLSW